VKVPETQGALPSVENQGVLNVTVYNLKEMSIADITALYNSRVGEDKQIKKFADKTSAIARTRVLLTPEEGGPKPRAPRGSGTVAEKAPRGPKTRELPPGEYVAPRPDSKRATLIRLITRKNGAKMAEIQEKLELINQARVSEALRIMNRESGVGFRVEDDTVHGIMPEGDTVGAAPASAEA
jgi:hypothetical protein